MSSANSTDGSFCNSAIATPLCLGIVIGCPVAGIVVILLLVVLPVCFCVRRRKRRQRRKRDDDSTKPPHCSDDKTHIDTTKAGHLDKAPGAGDAIQLDKVEKSSSRGLETSSKGGEKSGEIASGDAAEQKTDKENEGSQHKDDLVLLEKGDAKSTSVNYKCHVLENALLQSKTEKIPTLVVSIKKSDEGKNFMSDECEGKMEASSSSDAVASTKEISKSSFHTSGSSRFTKSSKPPCERINFEEPWVPSRPPPKESTHSTTTSGSPPNITNLFDDPAYDVIILNGSFENAGQTSQPSISETSSVTQPSTPGPMRQSKILRFDHESKGLVSDLAKKGPSEVQGMDEMPRNFQQGDLSEPEPNMTAASSCYSGDSGKKSAIPFSGNQLGTNNSFSSHKQNAEQKTGGSYSIYESQILGFDSEPHPRKEQYETEVASASRRSHEMTSLKLVRDSSLFDDPMYDFGLNLSKTEK